MLKLEPPIQVAAIVAVEKFLLPREYSWIFFIPRPERIPNIKFIIKNPVTIIISKFNVIIDDNNLKLMQKFFLTYEQNKQSTEKDFLKIKNDNNLLNCEIETLIEEKNSMKSNFQSKIDSLLAECSNLNTTIQELNEKLIKNENSLKNEKDDFMIKNEEITQMYQIATKEKFELEGVVIMLTETIKKMQTEFKDKLVCLMSGKYKNENIITNLGKDLIHMIKVNK